MRPLCPWRRPCCMRTLACKPGSRIWWRSEVWCKLLAPTVLRIARRARSADAATASPTDDDGHKELGETEADENDSDDGESWHYSRLSYPWVCDYSLACEPS